MYYDNENRETLPLNEDGSKAINETTLRVINKMLLKQAEKVNSILREHDRYVQDLVARVKYEVIFFDMRLKTIEERMYALEHPYGQSIP